MSKFQIIEGHKDRTKKQRIEDSKKILEKVIAYEPEEVIVIALRCKDFEFEFENSPIENIYETLGYIEKLKNVIFNVQNNH